MIFNEFILLLHAVAIVGVVFAALKYGKDLLVTLIALFGILANILILKQIDLFGLHVTCTDVFMIGQLIGLNILQERYGAQESNRAISISFLSSVICIGLGLFHLWYSPNAFDETHFFYKTILAPMPRIAITSVVIDFLSNHLERFLYTKLSLFFNKRFFILRNIITMTISQLFDTVAFSYIALYGIVASIPHIIISSLFIKLALIISMTLLSAGTYAITIKEDQP